MIDGGFEQSFDTAAVRCIGMLGIVRSRKNRFFTFTGYNVTLEPWCRS